MNYQEIKNNISKNEPSISSYDLLEESNRQYFADVKWQYRGTEVPAKLLEAICKWLEESDVHYELKDFDFAVWQKYGKNRIYIRFKNKSVGYIDFTVSDIGPIGDGKKGLDASLCFSDYIDTMPLDNFLIKIEKLSSYAHFFIN